jgi:hypothetical protein
MKSLFLFPLVKNAKEKFEKKKKYQSKMIFFFFWPKTKK